jgi:type VI secretion system secreted protein VgrG
MASYTQAHRRISLASPLGPDVLLLRAFTGSEAMSQLFRFDMDLVSEKDSITFRDLVGKKVTASIADADGVDRHWNGFISRFSQGYRTKRFKS